MQILSVCAKMAVKMEKAHQVPVALKAREARDKREKEKSRCHKSELGKIYQLRCRTKLEIIRILQMLQIEYQSQTSRSSTLLKDGKYFTGAFLKAINERFLIF